MSTNPKDNLSPLLRQWKVEAELAPRFKERVWLAVERQRSQPAAAPVPWFARAQEWLNASFRRPAYTTIYFLVVMTIGLAGGLTKGSADESRFEEMGRAKYLQLVNPYDRHSAHLP